MLLVLLVFNTRIVTRQVILIKFQCNICSDLTVSSSCSSFFCPLAFQKERASKVEKAEENEGFENLDAIGIGEKKYYKKSFFLSLFLSISAAGCEEGVGVFNCPLPSFPGCRRQSATFHRQSINQKNFIEREESLVTGWCALSAEARDV